MYAEKSAFEALGIKMSAIVKEDLPGKDGAPGEIEQFRKGFWPDLPVYLDSKTEFYRTIAGGAENRTSLWSFFAKLANPFGLMKKNMKRVPGDVPGNFVGEGFIHGGVRERRVRRRSKPRASRNVPAGLRRQGQGGLR